MDLNKIQKEIIRNKIEKGFNTTDVGSQFLMLYGEVAEAYEAYWKKKDDLGLELADIAIYLLGLAEMLGFSLEDEIIKKMEINKNRQYDLINGVLTKKKK